MLEVDVEQVRQMMADRGISVDDFGPRQSADAILRFEHRESVLELASTREPRKTTASDHDVGERHRGTHLLRHRLGCPSK